MKLGLADEKEKKKAMKIVSGIAGTGRTPASITRA